MTRRLIGLITLALGILVGPLAADTPPTATPRRIGLLTFAAGSLLRDAFQQSLHDLGYIEGENLAVEARDAGGKVERLPDLAAELVRREVEVIVAGGYAAVRAAQQATPTIPIVMLVGGDPIGSGLLPSLTRRGGTSPAGQASPRDSASNGSRCSRWCSPPPPTSRSSSIRAMRAGPSIGPSSRRPPACWGCGSNHWKCTTPTPLSGRSPRCARSGSRRSSRSAMSLPSTIGPTL